MAAVSTAESSEDSCPSVSWKSFESKSSVGLHALKIANEVCSAAIKSRGSCSVAVSGGSFPKILAEGFKAAKSSGESVDCSKWKVFWADERCVRLSHSDSSYKGFKDAIMAEDCPANFSADQVFPIDDSLLVSDGSEEGSNTAESVRLVAEDYESRIRKELGLEGTSPVQFDVVFLGMGPDGHTASLFPGHELLKYDASVVAAILDSPKPPPQRVTLSLPCICQAKCVIFVVTGESKADKVSAIQGGSKDYPAGLVTANSKGAVHWVLDASAAKGILSKI